MSNVSINGEINLSYEYNIKNFGEDAYKIVDKISELRIKSCNINIVTEESDDCLLNDSIGVFIGDIRFIDFELIKEDEFIDKNIKIDKDINTEQRANLLRGAYQKSIGVLDGKLQEFLFENISWLEDYSVYMSTKKIIGMDNLSDWKIYKARNIESIEILKEKFRDEINYNIFIQYEFHKQWRNLKNYFLSRGINVKRIYKEIK
ncbi:MAG: 4-alpha-glucanotransferase [Sarcina sp.]